MPLKQEDWDYITANWASTDPLVLQRVVEIRSRVDAEAAAAAEEAAAKAKRIQELETTNQRLNSDNMNMFMKFYEEGVGTTNDDGDKPPAVADLTDLDAFFKD